MRQRAIHRQRGAALLILMSILGLIGALFAMRLFSEGNRLAQTATGTAATLREATDALVGYAAAQPLPYLPCPDRTTGAGANDGLEEARVAGACPVAEGNLPWKTLGLQGKDPWGNRLRYRADPNFSNSSTGIQLTTVQAVPPVTVNIINSSGTTIANNLVLVVLSHGQNTWGATSGGGSAIANAPAANTNERENTDGDTTYVSAPQADSTAAGGEFDDQAGWLTTAQLIARLQAAGRL